jgi:hypothetical protein
VGIARLGIVLAFVVTSALASCSLLPCVERRHGSGLLIVCAEAIRQMPEALGAAGSFAWALADEHPDAFGFPWADPDTGAVELRVTGPQAEPFISAWMAGAATQGAREKTLPIPRAEVPVRRVTVDRSVRELTALIDRIVPPKDLPDGDLIFEVGRDLRRNAIVVTVSRESDALLRALAAKYGTSAIVIRIETRARAMPL